MLDIFKKMLVFFKKVMLDIFKKVMLDIFKKRNASCQKSNAGYLKQCQFFLKK